MKLTERGAASLNSTVYLSGALISLTAVNSARARDADAGRRLADAVVGRLYVGGGEVRPVVELHALAQVERVGLAVLGDFPAMRQIGDDGLAAVARIAPDQVVEHASLGADVADGARLMHVEMRRAIEDAVAHHAAALRTWLPAPPSETSTRRTRTGYRRRGRSAEPDRRPPSTRRRCREACRGGTNRYAQDDWYSCCRYPPFGLISSERLSGELCRDGAGRHLPAGIPPTTANSAVTMGG